MNGRNCTRNETRVILYDQEQIVVPPHDVDLSFLVGMPLHRVDLMVDDRYETI